MKASILVTALLAGASTLAMANTPIVAGSGWQDDVLVSSGDSQTMYSDWTFTIDPGYVGWFKVTDCCVVKDTYKLYDVSTSKLLLLSTFYAGAPTQLDNDFPYEEAWRDSAYSKLDWKVNSPGDYTFRIKGDIVGGFPAGLGVRLDVAAVPEPATWAMMLIGLGVAGALARRRSAAAEA